MVSALRYIGRLIYWFFTVGCVMSVESCGFCHVGCTIYRLIGISVVHCRLSGISVVHCRLSGVSVVHEVHRLVECQAVLAYRLCGISAVLSVVQHLGFTVDWGISIGIVGHCRLSGISVVQCRLCSMSVDCYIVNNISVDCHLGCTVSWLSRSTGASVMHCRLYCVFM